MNSPQKAPILRLPPAVHVLVVVFSVAICGCPPTPPSQEDQRRAMTAHWITVEPDPSDKKARSCLEQNDFDAIIATVPTISNAISETVRTGTLKSDGVEFESSVCGTLPGYLRLLEEGARVSLKQGRFLDSADAENEASIIVLSESAANKLFSDENPVGQTLSFANQQLTVVGVVTDGGSWGSDLTFDAYVPHQFLENGDDPKTPLLYARFRFRVDSMDQIKNTEAIIQNIIQQRCPDQNLVVRSYLSER